MRNGKIPWFKVVGIICIVIVVCVLIIDYINIQKQRRENDAYVDYTCRDYHLVCMNLDERVGRYYIEVEGIEYEFRYGTLNGVSDKELVYAYKTVLFPGFGGQNLILQSPSYNSDILNEWEISEVELYYYDRGDKRNPDMDEMTTAEDYITYEIQSTSSKEIMQQIRELSLNTLPENDLLSSIVEEPYTYKVNGEVYVNVLDEETTLSLRLHFKESESIAWDTEIMILRAKEDSSKYVITAEKGALDENYQKNYCQVALEPSSELYKMIWEAYEESLVQFMEKTVKGTQQ